MFPVINIDSVTIDGLLFSLSALSILLLAGIWLRLKIRFLKRLFMPAALIAGFLGLLLGQHGVGLLSPDLVDSWSLFPELLINVVFAPMLIGVKIPNLKRVFNSVGPQIFSAYLASFLQFSIPLLLSAFVLGPLWHLNDLFGTIVEVGWTGGHGTASGLHDLYVQLGWEAGSPLCLTSATIGLLVGIFSGLIIINYGVRKGYASIITSLDEVNYNKADDILSKEMQTPGSKITINNDVVEPFAFHGALIGLSIFLGWIMHYFLVLWTGAPLPLFPFAMIGGVIIQIVISKTRWYEMIDRMTLQRIQGIALELLIVAAISAIQVPIVIEYAVPLIIQMGVTILFMLVFFFYFGPRIFKEAWFENTLVSYGTATGVVAVGLMLLRTVDPEMRTNAGEAFSLRSVFVSPFIGGGLITSAVPVLVISYGAMTIGFVFLALTIICVLLFKVFGWWSPSMIKRL